jgi:hypothetical protein
MNRLASRAASTWACLVACCLLAACGGSGSAGASTDPGGDTSGTTTGGTTTGGTTGGSTGGTTGGGDTPGGTDPGGDAATLRFQAASHAITVTGGKPFSLAANFFDDRFVPAAPVSNYGFPVPVIPVTNADGSLDVAWIDYSATAAVPSASGLATLGQVSITHIGADLATASTVATSIKSYRLLGFTRDPSGNFYLAYNADSSFKTGTQGDPNNVNGNELRIARSSTASFASKAWDTLVFGDVDNHQPKSAGQPGEAGSGVLGFDAQNNVLVTYVSHEMAWDLNGVRHQAGILRLLDPASGAVLAPNNGNPWEMGSGWFYSHNFNQRLLIDGGTYYTLAHGDAYSRQLGVSAFTKAKYLANDSTVFDKGYWTIPGSVGDNTTNAETGQFFKLASGSLAIAHTSADGRRARDVRLVLADAGTGASSASAWLTTGAAHQEAVMPKIGPLGKRIFLTYGVWDSSSRTNHKISWYGQLVDTTLAPVASAKPLDGVEFIPGQPLFTFPGGPNAGALGWVSGNGQGGLTVNVVKLGP